MKLTLTGIRGQIARLLRDNGINSSQFDPDRVLRAITLACDETAKRTGSTYVETTVGQINGKAILPVGIIQIIRVYIESGASPVLPSGSTNIQDATEVTALAIIGIAEHAPNWEG